MCSGGEVLGALEGQISCAERWEQLDAPTSRIFNLAVADNARRRGIATALVKRFALNAADAGRRSLVCFVDLYEPRQGRIAFFESCGLRWLDDELLYMGADLPLDARERT